MTSHPNTNPIEIRARALMAEGRSFDEAYATAMREYAHSHLTEDGKRSEPKPENPIEARAHALIAEGVGYTDAWARALNEYQRGQLGGKR